jgi:hypothetical protein
MKTKGRNYSELSRVVELTRSFAILDREITFEELSAFAPDFIEIMNQFSALDNDVGCGIDWYDCVMFARWLGAELGFPESSQGYPTPDTSETSETTTDATARQIPRNWKLNLDARGFRLPTSAEWEVATRCGTKTSFAFGNDYLRLGNFGWFVENSGKKLHPPKLLRPNCRGLFDVHGNVWEWTHDWVEDFRNTVQRDPQGADDGTEKVFRGGGLVTGPAYCRAAFQPNRQPNQRSDDLGFRLALSLPGIPQSPEADK